MDIGSVIFWAAIVLLVIYAVSIYNHLVRLKHNVSKAWSNIDVLLKQRHDEIPKLVETCKQYMKFEQETLERVMQARSQVAQARQNQDVPGLGLAEGALRMGLGQLFALAEDYPEHAILVEEQVARGLPGTARQRKLPASTNPN